MKKMKNTDTTNNSSNDIKDKKNLSPSIILGIVTSGLIIFSIVFLIIGTRIVSSGKNVKIFGYSFSVVVTESMYPVIKANDIIIIKDYDYSKLKVGDIIVYYNEEYNINVVHRIVKINADSTYTTKGDNNALEDSFPITKDIFIGKVVKYGNFLGIGNVISQYRWAIIIAIVLIFVYIINSELVSFIKLQKQKQIEEAKKEEEYNSLSYEERKALMREELLKELQEQENKKE